jgi:hypothetical protein
LIVKKGWVDPSRLGVTDFNAYLRRRNFTRIPWKAGHPSDAPTPAYVVDPVQVSLRWEYTHRSRGFNRAAMPAEIAKIQADAKQYGPDFDKP